MQIRDANVRKTFPRHRAHLVSLGVEQGREVHLVPVHRLIVEEKLVCVKLIDEIFLRFVMQVQ